MASFKAPALFTTISNTLYETQINQNFVKIQSSFEVIQTDLSALAGTPLTGATNNLNYVDELLGVPRLANGGVLGKDAFFPTFTETTDGWILTITHPTLGSQAVVNSVFHRATVIQTFNVSLLASVEETQRFVYGITTAGVPALTHSLDESSGATDDSAGMNIWSFDFLRTTDGEKIVNLQREAPLLVDREMITILQDEVIQFDLRFDGIIGASVGLFGVPIILPFDCEILEVAAWLGTLPDVTDQRGLEFQVLLNGEEEIHDGLFQFGNQTDADPASTVVTGAGLIDPVQAREDEFLRLNFLDADPEDVASDLLVAVRVRRLYHEVRRRTDP